MNNLRNDRFLCFDLELTCWSGAPPAGQRPEIIEIGIVEVASADFSILREERYLVRPRFSTASDFCAGLTGLTQGDLEGDGRPLPEVVRTLAKKFGPAHKRLVLWGDDWSAIERDCAALSVANPFPRDAVFDLGALMALTRARSARMSLTDALAEFGLAFEGRQHSAVDDARNTVRLFAAVVARMRGGMMPA